MYANGFFEEKRRSPVSFAAVLGLHGAALGAVILFGTTTFQKQEPRRLIAVNIRDIPPPPDVLPPPPQPDRPQPRQLDQVTTARPLISLDAPINARPTPPQPYQPPTTPPGDRIVLAENTRVEIPPPVRHGAEVDPRYRDALQPPYPASEERLQREGRVQMRITIGTDGRVTAIERLSATSDAFWRVTESQARGRWRFRPATVDGRPVVSTMNFTITFRLPEA